jgi:sulfite exporter TauE/SafE
MGIAWGFMPCAMVYGALMMALLTGSGFGGAMLMAGFALGTLPALVVTSLGLRTLAAANHRAHARTAVGLTIAAFGFATVYLPEAALAVICR